jgi:hypothetical protein
VLCEALGSREQSNTPAVVSDKFHVPITETFDSFTDYVTKYLHNIFFFTIHMVGSVIDEVLSYLGLRCAASVCQILYLVSDTSDAAMIY